MQLTSLITEQHMNGHNFSQSVLAVKELAENYQKHNS